jgi:hypothetical protein
MTAVEYLVELLNFDGYVSEDTINKAKEMEKQQIIDAKDCWLEDERDGEQYYNQTYKTTQ